MFSASLAVLVPFAIGFHAGLCAQPTAIDPPAVAAQPVDVTKPFRRPGELVAKCGPASVKTLGLWPDMQAQMEGRGPLYVNRPLHGAINARGQALVVTEKVPTDGVTRNAETGLVQYVVKGRPASGVLNERGDMFGQVVIDNPKTQEGGERLHQAYAARAFMLPSGAKEPVFVDAPEGHDIQAVSLSEDGAGLGVLIKGHSEAGELTIRPVKVTVDATGRAAWTHLVDPSALPKGVTSCVPCSTNGKGAVLVGMQAPTGALRSAAFKGDNGEWVQTCPSIIESVSCTGLLKDGKIELIPMPKGYVELSAVGMADGGAVVATATRWVGEASFQDGFVWRQGEHIRLESFADDAVLQVTDSDGGLACGIVNVPHAALGADHRKVPVKEREAFYAFQGCGAIWELTAGRFITLDSLLPAGTDCTHISAALAIKGDKVLCTGLVGGKLHALVITLPQGVEKGFARLSHP